MTPGAAPTMRRVADSKRQQAVGALAGVVDRFFNDNVLRAKRAPRGSADQYVESLSAFVSRWNEPRWFTDPDACVAALPRHHLERCV